MGDSAGNIHHEDDGELWVQVCFIITSIVGWGGGASPGHNVQRVFRNMLSLRKEYNTKDEMSLNVSIFTYRNHFFQKLSIHTHTYIYTFTSTHIHTFTSTHA